MVLPVQAENPYVHWATVMGGPGDDYTGGPVLAPSGELWVINGSWNGPSILRTLDTRGRIVREQTFHGAALGGIAFAANGDYYLTGTVTEPALFGFGHTNDFFLAKHAPAGGLIWVRTAGTPDYSPNWSSGGSDVAVDPAGNVYVTGSSRGPAVFGPTVFGDGGGPLLCKYDPAGNLLWVKRPEDPTGAGGAGRLAVDQDGNVAITGFLSNGDVDFGGVVVTIDGPYGAYPFVAKYSATGQAQWAKNAHGGRGVAMDRQGNVYCAGDWVSASRFSPGGTLLWEKSFPGAYCRVTLNSRDEPLLFGQFEGTVDFGGTVLQDQTVGWYDIFLCKANPEGNIQWAISGGGPEYDAGHFASCDSAGNIYLTGQIRKSLGMLGSVPLIPLFPNDGVLDADVFVARITEAPPLTITPNPQNIILSWPVQATNYFLEAATSMPALSWDSVTNTPTVTTNERSVQLPLTGPAQFFRLRQP
jgi:hypothetical protein